jgi:aminopeptidase-like protein
MYDLLDSLFDRLFPLPRSIMGRGIEESLRVIGEVMPLSLTGVPSGTRVFDWTVPRRWECAGAVLTGEDGGVWADFGESNLRVVNYSAPVDGYFTLEELDSHLHSLPGLPEAIPYVTSYYKPSWGFCLRHSERERMGRGRYHAKIDSSFSDGEVVVADCLLPGESGEEIFLSSYLCHPSLANNELSGPLVLAGLYLRLREWPRRRFSYRFALNPETIGSLCYLHLNGARMTERVAAGMLLTCLGGPSGSLSYKKSRGGGSVADRLAERWASRGAMALREFTPVNGSDERQYNSPGFNLPIGQVARTLDDKGFMGIAPLIESVDTLEAFLMELDDSGFFVNLSPYGEPQLGRRDLYPNVNSDETRKYSDDELSDERKTLDRMLTILSYSDGRHDMIDIAKKCSCGVGEMKGAIDALEGCGLLRFQGGRRDMA